MAGKGFTSFQMAARRREGKEREGGGESSSPSLSKGFKFNPFPTHQVSHHHVHGAGLQGEMPSVPLEHVHQWCHALFLQRPEIGTSAGRGQVMVVASQMKGSIPYETSLREKGRSHMSEQQCNDNHLEGGCGMLIATPT